MAVTTVDGVTDLRQVLSGALNFVQVGGMVVMLALGVISHTLLSHSRGLSLFVHQAVLDNLAIEYFPSTMHWKTTPRFREPD